MDSKNLLPREKACHYGIESLSDTELLALILGSGYKGNNVLTLANDILVQTGSLEKLMMLPIREIMKLKGVKLAKATQLVASFELVKRLNYQNLLNQDVINDPKTLIKWLKSRIGLQQQEILIVALLNSKNQVIGFDELFKGSLDHVNINVRDIYALALRRQAAKIIIAHNHPSQSVKPSESDIAMTRDVAEAGSLLNLPLVDHIIISYDDYFSFCENNLL